MSARLSMRQGIDGTEFDLTCDHGVVHSEQVSVRFTRSEVKACFLRWARRLPVETSDAVFQTRVVSDLLGRLARETFGCACSAHLSGPEPEGHATRRGSIPWHD